MAPDTPGNGLLQTIGTLSERIGHFIPLRNRLRQVWKRDHKSPVLLLWGQAGRIHKVLHSKLLQISAAQAKLG
jgi:hypothetical protein